MKMFLGLIAQFGLILGQVNPDDFNEIAQVLFEHLRGVFRGMDSLGYVGNMNIVISLIQSIFKTLCVDFYTERGVKESTITTDYVANGAEAIVYR